jgi:hypothetical protein
MVFNLLLFPLVAGYYILVRFKFLKFLHQRLDRQKLLFNSVLLGVGILIITFVLRYTAEAIAPDFIALLYSLFPLKVPFVGTAFFCLPIAMIFAEVANFFLTENNAIKRAIKRRGNEMELIFASSFEDEVLLQLTLDNGKFYIGWVKELPVPQVSNYTRIIPAFSGYRNEETKRLIFTTQYLSVYSEYLLEGKIKNISDLRSDLVIDISHVVSVGFFDLEMYNRFNRGYKVQTG